MSALLIQDIFSQFDNYRSEYLTILQNPELYYQHVQDAKICFAKYSEEKVYLGDLLQLWFSQKWTDQQIHALDDLTYSSSKFKHAHSHQNTQFFIFALGREGLFSKNLAWVWDSNHHTYHQIELPQILPFYCHYLSVKRPKRCA